MLPSVFTSILDFFQVHTFLLQSTRIFVKSTRIVFLSLFFFMDEKPLQIGKLYISNEVLQHETWMKDQAVSSAIAQLNKYKGFDGLLKPSSVRLGDYSLVLCKLDVDPIVVLFVGIPGRSKAAIIQELFFSG